MNDKPTKWQALWQALLAVLESEVTAYVWADVCLFIAGIAGAGLGGGAGVVLFVCACVVVGIVAWAGKSDAS